MGVHKQTSTGPYQGEPIRVLFVVDSLNVGGTESQVAQVASRLHGDQYRLTLACLHATGPLLAVVQNAGIPVVEFSPKGSLISLSGAQQYLRLRRFIRRERFHVVHAHDLWSNLLAVPAAYLARAPVIISSRRDLGHLPWYTPTRIRVLRWIQGLSDVVIANSDGVRNFVVAKHGLPAARVRVLHNAVDYQRFASAHGDRAKLFATLDAQQILVAVLANMRTPVKGHAELVAAAREVCGEFAMVKFLLIGEGGLQPAIDQQIRERGLEKHFMFLGHRDDVAEVLRCCDFSVFPSKAEGFPNAVLESMAAGLPVVATQIESIREIIRDGEHGLLVPPGDAGALAQAILRLLRSRELARGLARAGQERVAREFSYDRLLSGLRSLYGELLGDRAG